MKIYNYLKFAFDEKIRQEFKSTKIGEEIEQNEMMSRKHKMVCRNLNYIEHFLILDCAINGFISIFVFASLPCIPIGITSSEIRLETCAIAAGIKKYKSIANKKKKKTYK